MPGRPNNERQPNRSKGPKKPKKKRSMAEVIVGRRSFKITMKALRDMKRLQSSYDLLIPKLSFDRVVKEIMQDINSERSHQFMHVQSAALRALQEASEAYLTQYLEDSYLCSFHAKRVTLQVPDVELCTILRELYELM